MEKDTDIIFATIAQPRSRSEADALILAHSIRAFGGSLNGSPIWCFTPNSTSESSPRFVKASEDLRMQLKPFQIDEEELRRWFVPHAKAAATAEAQAEGVFDTLAWLNPNAVVVHEPSTFLLPRHISLGYRPVHHALIGSVYDQSLDPFWSRIYGICEVPEERIFPMKTHVENVLIRPYFNAGFLVLKPELGLLRSWEKLFVPSYSSPEFARFYDIDKRYEIFIHQAILSGLILSMTERVEILELPPTYNYPAHLHSADTTPDRPRTMDDTVVFRHEGFYAQEDWSDSFPASRQLTSWLSERLAEISEV